MTTKYKKFGKRLFDIVCSLSGLIILLPFLILISLLIKVFSPGPIFFLQERMGMGGNIFKLIKFRSMRISSMQEKNNFTPGDTTRITRLGKFIRRTKIDELPELINVLRGEMSLVGPRPEVPEYRNLYAGKYDDVLTLRPGITDWASIKYCNEEELLAKSSNPEAIYLNKIFWDKLEMNLEYVKNMSFWTDLRILFATVLRIIAPG